MDPGLPAPPSQRLACHHCGVPSFCRHNRLLQNCTICAREQSFAVRPVISPGGHRSDQPRGRAGGAARSPERGADGRRAAAAGGLRVRRLARGAEDGYSSALVPGLRSSADALRLAEAVAAAATRLEAMELVAAGEPVSGAPEIWSEIAGSGDADAGARLAAAHVLGGPRGVAAQDRVAALAGFEAWGARAGSLTHALGGEAAWTAERRFERAFERLGGVSGFHRDVRFELLTLLGQLGVHPLRAGSLFLTGENEATWAAKRAFGIGDPLLLDRRAAALAEACEVPLDALDLALHAWGAGEPAGGELGEDPTDRMSAPDRAPIAARAVSALGL